NRDRLRGGEARGRRQRALRFSRLSLRAGAEDALSALLQAPACSLARFRPRNWHRAWAEALLVDPFARDTAEPTARASLRGAASADSVGSQRSDDRRRAARFLSLRRQRLQRRGRSGGAIGPQGVDVLDRLRLRCRVRDAVCSRGRAAISYRPSRADLCAGARARALTEVEVLVRRAVCRRIVDADESRLG